VHHDPKLQDLHNQPLLLITNYMQTV
jgi:hypothetical protein